MSSGSCLLPSEWASLPSGILPLVARRLKGFTEEAGLQEVVSVLHSCPILSLSQSTVPGKVAGTPSGLYGDWEAMVHGDGGP